jgi:hypothetical protein
MTAEELVNEAWPLARPCVFLRDKGPKGDLAAVWGGPGIVPPPKKQPMDRHWLSINCWAFKEFLHRNKYKVGPTEGVLSVYTDGEGGGVAVLDKKAKLTIDKKATALYAHPGRSLPPLDAVFQLGSPAVQAWLKDNKWKPEWPFNNNFKDKAPAQAYEKRYAGLCPLYGKIEAYAVLGGWHFPWPDGDWTELRDRALLVWTFEESEPWIEVWADGKDFEVKERIT